MDASRAGNSVEIKNEESDESMLTMESEAMVKLESLYSSATSHNVYDSQFDVFQHELSSGGEIDPLAVTSDCISEQGTALEWVQQEPAFDKSLVKRTRGRPRGRGVRTRGGRGASVSGAANAGRSRGRGRGRGRGNLRTEPIVDESRSRARGYKRAIETRAAEEGDGPSRGRGRGRGNRRPQPIDESQYSNSRGAKRGRGAAGAASVADESNGPSRGRGRGRGNPRARPVHELEPERGVTTVQSPQVQTAPPSPIAFEACGVEASAPSMSSVPFASASGTSLKRRDVNYGSDDDSASEDDDEEPIVPVFIPRVDRALYFDDDDDDDSDRREQTAEPTVTPQGYMPRDLFHYDWVNFPSPGTAERRETFRAGEIGPTEVFSTPYEAFTAIWTPEFMETIVLETNRYAQLTIELKTQDGTLGPCSRLTRWQDTDVDELYVYFALLLATGSCVKNNAKEYWANGDVTATPGFAQYMSYNRYLLLNSCLHFVDNKTDLRTMSQSKARVFKIQPVIQHLNDRFQALYTLGRNIAVDESLIQWKGWLAFRQFIKTKAAGVGVKTYELCDSRTGYLWRFKVYTGRERDMGVEVTPRSEYTVSLVLELLKGLEDKGYTVWMDNFYNSPVLARVMKSLGFDCAGTLRTSRRFVPPHIRSIKAKDMVLGEVTGCTSGDVDILLWRDANRVAMISTYHGAGVTTARNKTKPNVVHDYNMCMGGVDKKDQMLSGYPIERKRSRIWYKKFFRRLLNVSVLNAYILHRDCTVPDIYPHIRKHRAFRKALVAELLERHQNDNIIAPVNLEIKLMRKVVLPPTALEHFPKQYDLVSNTTKKERIRRTCVVCHKRQSIYCAACNVPLCLGKCIVQYHS